MEVIGADRYTLDKLPEFEANVDAQVAGRAPYNLAVNVAVLRLYQLQPSQAKPGMVGKILLKAIMQLPAPDYKICSQVLSEKTQAEEPVATVALLAQHLESFRLQDFWALANSCRDLLATVPGFHEAVRRFITHSISLGCQRVRVAALGESLQLGGAEVAALLASQEKAAGWKVVSGGAGGDVVLLPRNTVSATAPKATKGAISFDAVAPALRKMAVH